MLFKICTKIFIKVFLCLCLRFQIIIFRKSETKLVYCSKFYISISSLLPSVHFCFQHTWLCSLHFLWEFLLCKTASSYWLYRAPVLRNKMPHLSNLTAFTKWKFSVFLKRTDLLHQLCRLPQRKETLPGMLYTVVKRPFNLIIVKMCFFPNCSTSSVWFWYFSNWSLWSLPSWSRHLCRSCWAFFQTDAACLLLNILILQCTLYR